MRFALGIHARGTSSDTSWTSCRLFARIEEMQGQGSWGTVLDAGTGQHSMDWLLGLNTDSVAAITADEQMRQTVLSKVKALRKDVDRVIIGDWKVLVEWHSTDTTTGG